MIGKIVKGNYFRGVLDYLANKKQSKLIGGNMSGTTPKDLAAEFSLSRQLNYRLKQIVNHVSLSLPIGETVDELTWQKIASDYIQAMGFKGSQYAVYRHSDRQHDHVHIVASRVKITDGSTVSDSWDYRRSDLEIRDLEKKYQLTQVQSAWDKERRSITRGELEYLKKTGKTSVRVKLQSSLDAIAPKAGTMANFLATIQSSGINFWIDCHNDGKIKGISYELDGVSFPGYKLGRAYSFFGLQKYRNVRYNSIKNPNLYEVDALKANYQQALDNLSDRKIHVEQPILLVEGNGETIQLERSLVAPSLSSNTATVEEVDRTATENTEITSIPSNKFIAIEAHLKRRDKKNLNNKVEQPNSSLTAVEIDEAKYYGAILSKCALYGRSTDKVTYTLFNEEKQCQIAWNRSSRRLTLTNTEEDRQVLIVEGDRVINYSNRSGDRAFTLDVTDTIEKSLAEFLELKLQKDRDLKKANSLRQQNRSPQLEM